jgi:hypothetical protein
MPRTATLPGHNGWNELVNGSQGHVPKPTRHGARFAQEGSRRHTSQWRPQQPDHPTLSTESAYWLAMHLWCVVA